MVGDAPNDHFPFYPFQSLVREVAADAAAQPDPDTCLRHLRGGLIRLGFVRAGVWVIDADDPSRSNGTWGTDWDGSEFDAHGVTKANQEIPGAVQIEAGERLVLGRVSQPSDAMPLPYVFVEAADGHTNQATVALRAGGRSLLSKKSISTQLSIGCRRCCAA